MKVSIHKLKIDIFTKNLYFYVCHFEETRYNLLFTMRISNDDFFFMYHT